VNDDGRIAVRTPEAVWEDVDSDVEGLLDEWLVQSGEHVLADQEIASVMIVKTSVAVPAPASGTLTDILVEPGETFGRDRDLAIITVEVTGA
jgi:pyruvate/2-oxoglutarate dehydrogenase complex dihydrolipoamide acyltransferase (E2) component